MKKTRQIFAITLVVILSTCAFFIKGYAANEPGEWLELTQVSEPVDYAYSFSVIGDIQTLNRYYPDKLNAMYDWIAGNAESKKMAYCVGLGDVTDQNTDAEYSRVVLAYNKLVGKVPFSIIRGNHDSEYYTNGKSADTSVKFDSYITPALYGSQIDGAYEADSMKNTYKIITVGNTKYLFMNLDFHLSDGALEWAGDIISDNKDCRVIVSTHIYNSPNGIQSTSTSYFVQNTGVQLWDKLLSKHENIVMVLNGHDPSDDIYYGYRRGDNGNSVLEMVIDPQRTDHAYDSDYPTGENGAGLVAMLYFSRDGRRVDVRYYSTDKDKYFKANNQFTVNIDASGVQENRPAGSDGKTNEILMFDEDFDDESKLASWKDSIVGSLSDIKNDGNFDIVDGALVMKSNVEEATYFGPRFKLYTVPDSAKTFTVEIKFKSEQYRDGGGTNLIIADNGLFPSGTQGSTENQAAIQMFWLRKGWTSGVVSYARSSTAATSNRVNMVTGPDYDDWYTLSISVDLTTKKGKATLIQNDGTVVLNGTEFNYEPFGKNIGLMCYRTVSTVDYVKVYASFNDAPEFYDDFSIPFDVFGNGKNDTTVSKVSTGIRVNNTGTSEVRAILYTPPATKGFTASLDFTVNAKKASGSDVSLILSDGSNTVRMKLSPDQTGKHNIRVYVPDVSENVEQIAYYVIKNAETGVVNEGSFAYRPTANGYIGILVKNVDVTLNKLQIWGDDPTDTKFTRANMSVGTDLSLNFYATVNGELGTPVFKLTDKDGNDVRAENVEISRVSGQINTYKIAYTGIAPQYMGDSVTAELVSGRLKSEVKVSKSVKQYCDQIISGGGAYADLARAILAYGAKAQEYKNYDIENLVTTAQPRFTYSGGVIDHNITGTVQDAYFTAAGLYFDYTNKLFFKFYAKDLNEVTVKLNGEIVDKIDVIDCGNNIYKIYTEDIYASEILKAKATVSLTVGTETTTVTDYEVLTYISRKAGNDSIGKLVNALYNYGVEALRIFESEGPFETGGNDEDIF